MGSKELFRCCRITILSSAVRHTFQLLLVQSIIFLIVFAGAACTRRSPEAGDSQTKIVKSPDPSVVEISHPERFTLAETEGRKVGDEIHANGVVAPDVNRSVGVLSLAGGRVVDIKARLGDTVRKGQLLLRIHSPDLASAFSDLQKAQADESLSRKQLERSKSLYEHGAIAERDLEAAQNAEDKAMVDLKTAANHIRILGGDPDHVSSVVDIRAPISGTIVEQNVTGSAGVRSLDATPNLFTIADLSRVWVLCDLYEDVISQLHLGDTAEVTLNAYPDRTLHGRVSNIGSMLDPNTRAAKVRIELNNPGMVMRAGMFATAVFHSEKTHERPVLPASSIVRLHDKNWVFKPLGGNRFRKMEVQTGPPAGNNLVQILSGVKTRDKVVANALQFSNTSETQ